MKNEAARAKSRSRPRKKAETSAAPAPAQSPAQPPPAPGNPKNVGTLESAASLALGVLFLAGALFPRSLKQFFLLGVGGGLVYRGMTSHCGLYQALGLDSAKGSLLGQANEKHLADPTSKND